mgnify:CR=1 FL=1
MPLKDNLEIPQTPWPDVHPFARRVPIPTIKPARTKTIAFVVALVLAGISKTMLQTIGANTKPAKNTILSLAVDHPDLSTKPPMMPLAPITLPFVNK